MINEENRQKVTDWLMDKDCCNLYFDDVNQSRFGYACHTDAGNLEDIVFMFLVYSRFIGSYRREVSLEEPTDAQITTLVLTTDPCRNRSVLDIWRHVKSVKSHITIFDTMNACKNLVERKRISSLFCKDISRRVFYAGLLRNGFSDENRSDEFNLTLSEWE